MIQYPTISIIALCYNQSNFVEQTLESIYNLNYPKLEVIIIDDCSTDSSSNVILNWIKNKNINWKFKINTYNIGVSKNLNWAIGHISGKYVKMISCDDILLPDSISILYNFIESCSEEVVVVFGDMKIIDINSDIISKSYLNDIGFSEFMLQGDLFTNLAKSCFIPAPATLFRVSLFKEFNFDESLIFEDWNLWLNISKKYKIGFIDKPIVLYRRLSYSLFHSLSLQFRNSLMKMAFKNLGYRKSADKYFKKIIIDNALSNYINGGSDSTIWLWRRFIFAPRVRNLYLVIKSIIK